MTTTRRARELVAGLLSMAFALGLCELGLRAIAERRPNEPPRLFGRPLPPLDPLPADRVGEPRWDEPMPEFQFEGHALTHGDLWGLSREDPVLGHEPLESSRSANGWWQSNALGARARKEYAPSPPPGVFRVLAFGDSFTNGSRVRQEDAWPAIIEARRPDLEVVNFGADGYGMGQSLLRYRKRRDALQYDLVILVSVPGADLEREVNTARWLLGWRAPLTPRFEIESHCGERGPPPGELRLVPLPYASMAELAADNRSAPSAKLLAHLRCHDAMYWPSRYESTPVIGRLYVWRLALAVLNAWRDEHSGPDELYQPTSEAARVTRAVFAAMAKEVEARGVAFLLVQLPTASEVGRARQDPGFVTRWQRLREFTCPAGTECLDLLPLLSGLDRAELDTSVGFHYGPHADRAIAGELERAVDAVRARRAERFSENRAAAGRPLATP